MCTSVTFLSIANILYIIYELYFIGHTDQEPNSPPKQSDYKTPSDKFNSSRTPKLYACTRSPSIIQYAFCLHQYSAPNLKHLNCKHAHPSSQVLERKASLEKIQRFALKMCSKNWNSQYSDLLQRIQLPSLESRRKLLKLSYLFQIRTGTSFFPNPPIISLLIDPRFRNHTTTLLDHPFAQTSAYKHSFFPDSATLCLKMPYMHITASV